MSANSRTVDFNLYLILISFETSMSFTLKLYDLSTNVCIKNIKR